MVFAELKIFKSDYGYTVNIDGDWAGDLSPDEALGTVASALFGCCKKPIFLKTPEENANMIKKYRCDGDQKLLLERNPMRVRVVYGSERGNV